MIAPSISRRPGESRHRYPPCQVELQSRQQQLIVARNDSPKQKLALSRIIGLRWVRRFALTDTAPTML